MRKFVITVTNEKKRTGYIKTISKLSLVYTYTTTNDIKNSKIWKYKSSAKKMCKKLETKKDPTHVTRATINHKYNVIEITDKRTSRILKLKKLFKKN